MYDSDLYYQSMHLFPSQQASDRIIAQVVSLLGCTDRLELGIVASPRGMVSGGLKLTAPSEERVECTVGQTTLIPTELDGGWKVHFHCNGEGDGEHLVLVVEKEAVFKQLIQARGVKGGIDWTKVTLLTGKGYPDHATRALVQLLTNHTCSHCGRGVKVAGLFDADPYGVDIWRQFQLRTPVEWVGVDLGDFVNTDLETQRRTQLVPLRNDERRMAVRLLRGLDDANDHVGLRRKLTEMLLVGYKVEIEAAYGFVPPRTDVGGTPEGGGLVGYLEHKLRQGAAMK